MATLTTNTQLTLLELANRSNDPNAIVVAEVLNETNEFLIDAVWLPANGDTTHKGSQRTSLPTGSWRKLNDGVAAEASQTKPVIENCGLLESYSKIDKELVDLAGNPLQFRSLEDRAFIEGLGQSFADAFTYGDTGSTPEKFKGLSPRVTSKTAANAVDASGTGSDTTSIWIVQWGPGKVHLFYPKSSKSVGITAEDLGVQTVAGSTSGTLMQAYMTHFIMRAGLFVADDRCIQRICNIETSGSSNIFDEDDLITALNRLPYNGAGAVIYTNATLKTQIDINAKNKTNVAYTSAEVYGRPVTLFRGVPVRRMDSILNTETALS